MGPDRIKARRNLRKDYLERYRAVVIEAHPELNVIRWLEEVRASRRGAKSSVNPTYRFSVRYTAGKPDERQ